MNRHRADQRRRTRRVFFEQLEFRRVLASITDVTFDLDTHIRLGTGSDNWPVTWSDDNHQYTSWGDGAGFHGGDKSGRVSLGFARVEGNWNNYTGHNIWGGTDPENPAQFKGKTYGMISIDGVLYMLNMVERKYFQESELYYSTNKGATWTSAGWKFEGLNSAFSVPTILNFGKDNAGARDEYVYVYAPGEKELLKSNSNTGFNSADEIDLARVRKDKILDKASYEFFAGLDNSGNPIWTPSATERKPVLRDPGKVHWTIQVAHVPGANRYVLFNNPGPGYKWPGSTGKLDVYEAPEPWGPWTKFKSFTDDWGFGYTFTHYVAPKWISPDGRDFTLVFSGGPGKNDSWNTVRGQFTISGDSLSVAFDKSSIAENAGRRAARGTVTRSTDDLSQPLTVTLTSSDSSELTVPAQVVIPASASSIGFDIDAEDDDLLDGRQTVTVTATAAGFDAANRSIDVTDYETLTAVVDQAEVAEDAGSQAARVTVTRSNSDNGQNLVVALGSSDTSEARLPAEVTIAANQSSATVWLEAVDDTLLDGTQRVVVQGTATGYETLTDRVDVTDHEEIRLSVSPSSVLENAGDGAVALKIERSNTDRSQSLVVNLASSDVTEIRVPDQATIPANAASVEIAVDVIDDAEADGDQNVQLTGTASGYVEGRANVRVLDDETGDARLILETDESEITEHEGAGATMGTVRRAGVPLGTPLSVSLASSDTSEVTVPQVVTIPATEFSVRFPIDAVDDRLLDGTQTARLTAFAQGFSSSEVSLNVHDHETVTVTFADSRVSENQGTEATQVTVTRSNLDNGSPLTVDLQSDDTSEATVPAEIRIPENAASATAWLDAVDDRLLDGDQVVTVTAGATGYVGVEGSITVADHEELILVVSPDRVAEDAGNSAATATLTRTNEDIAASLRVQLSSSDTSEARLPGEVTIPAGAASVAVSVDAVDDRLLDGVQRVVLQGTSAGYVSVSDELRVTDVETLTVQVVPGSVSEDAGAGAGLVTVERSNVDDSLPKLRVSLSGNDDTEATVPDFVEIPAGRASVSAPLTAVDDALLDGPQTVRITASAGGYVSVAGEVVVVDHETLTVEIADSTIGENDGKAATSARITRSVADLSEALVVSLTSDDDTEARVPAQATIAAGSSFVIVDVDAVDDAVYDGTQTARLSASADGYVSIADTVDVTDNEDPPELTLTFDTREIAENASEAVLGRVTRIQSDLQTALTVNLVSKDTTEFRVPASVVIPVGADSATFQAFAVDDDLLDGTQTVRVTATADSHVKAKASIDVTDHETISIVLDNDRIRENDGPGATHATVTRSNTDVDSTLVVLLDSSDTSEATVPASVTIPAGANSVRVAVDAVDDDILDGPQSLVLSASAAGYVGLSASLTVTDHEAIELVLPTTVLAETMGREAMRATVRRGNADNAQPLTVHLSSSDLTELVVPASVVIPAGESSAEFTVEAIDDPFPDGVQPVRLRASADAYVDADVTISVTDDESFSLILQDAAVPENAGAKGTRATLFTSGFSFEPVVVSLTSTDTSEARVPAEVTIPAGFATEHFDVAVIDDTLLDGPQVVYFVASTNDQLAAAKLVVLDHETLTVAIAEDEVPENAGVDAATATVTRSNTDNGLPLVVDLTSSDVSEATVPPSVTIPAGVSSATFTLTAIDDNILDGPQTVEVLAEAVGYVGVADSIVITDHESLDLELSPSRVTESDGAAAASLTVRRSNQDDAAPLTVQLRSSDTGELRVPATATIPAGSASATVDVEAVDDALLDGDQSVTVTATASGFEGATATIVVADHETIALVIAADSIAENDGPAATSATVTRSNTDTQQALVVSLESSDTTEATVPATVTIPAGSSSATIAVDAVDDDLLDGTQQVTLTASAAGYSGGSDQLDVTDYEAIELILDQDRVAENAGDGAFAGKVKRPASDTANPLTVQLTSSDTTELQLPDSVTIPAGKKSFVFRLDAVDDRLLDGHQDVVIKAEAPGYAAVESTVRVDDHETLTVQLSTNSVAENAGTAALVGTITRSNLDDPGSQTTPLTSSDVSEATVPASVTFAAGVATATFPVHAVDDTLLDGTRPVIVGADHAGFIVSPADLDVTDHETLTLTLADDRVSEAAGDQATTATLTRSNTDNQLPLTVSLSSSDTTAARLPGSIVIPGGSASVDVAVTAVDDDLLDGTQIAVLSGTVDPYISVSGRLEVEDDESISLSVSAKRIAENRGADAATLTATRPASQISDPLVISLTSSDLTELQVPASLTIPAGSTTGSVAFDVIDDRLLDGDQAVRITATTASFGSNQVEVVVEDYETLTVEIAAAAFSEAAGEKASAATVTRGNVDLSAAIQVTISVDDTTEAEAPASITIPAGAAAADFFIDAVDDQILDGTQTVTVRARAAGYVSVDDAVDVLDHEPLSLVLSPDAVSENGAAGSVTGTVTRSTDDLSEPLVVELAGSDGSELSVPTSVTISAGSREATFAASPVDDALLDGTQTVTVTATAAGFSAATDTVEVLDVEDLQVVIAADAIRENAGAGATSATVRRTNQDIDLPLTVQLATSDATEATLPAEATIPAGADSIVVPIDAVDDSEEDGDQTVTITATTAGYVDGTDTVVVEDHEPGLTLTISNAQVLENAGEGATTATISREAQDAVTREIVTLISSDRTEIILPLEVVLPAGATEVEFPVHARDDIEVDGTQTVSIRASSESLGSAVVDIEVLDHELWQNPFNRLDVNYDRAVTPIDANYVFGYWNNPNNPSRPPVPRSPNAPFYDVSGDGIISSIDALLIINFLNAVGSVTTRLEMAAEPNFVFESETELEGIVRRRGSDSSQPLMIVLENDKPEQAHVPEVVTIPAGQAQRLFAIRPVDDTEEDGDQLVQLIGEAGLHESARLAVWVGDDDGFPGGGGSGGGPGGEGEAEDEASILGPDVCFPRPFAESVDEVFQRWQ